eukprot:TRINITY_DN9400_c0_g1_i1.p1 TRINITY_DN9400_c0_g1~~TRINITY_DN9400_c0_g1_i1.p1  ORF type:complete len:267 (+),score=85.12 TRINITY_DN9400_c0_g1_i1:59-802(+)
MSLDSASSSDSTSSNSSVFLGDYEEVYNGTNLSVVSQNLDSIPADLSSRYPDATVLDLSFNNITVAKNLGGFKKLKNLVLDSNQIISTQDFPVIPSLDTLWVNNNQIEDLAPFIESVARAFPNLTYLSMLKNPACPSFFNGREQEDYQRYRYFVISKINRLRFLDSSDVTDAERQEALRVGHLMIAAKPESSQYKKKSGDSLDDLDSRPLAPAQDVRTSGRATYGVTRYVYYGRHSEGNRFITNSEL